MEDVTESCPEIHRRVFVCVAHVFVFMCLWSCRVICYIVSARCPHNMLKTSHLDLVETFLWSPQGKTQYYKNLIAMLKM